MKPIVPSGSNAAARASESPREGTVALVERDVACARRARGTQVPLPWRLSTRPFVRRRW
jgi:hypothetical protein